MNMQEAGYLTDTVSALCPAQAVDELTAEAWQLVLDDVSLADAMTAVRQIARRPDDKALWIDPRQVLTEVRRIRSKRLDVDMASLTGAPEAPAEYLAWYRCATAEIKSGRGASLPQIESAPSQRASAETIRRIRAAAKGLPGKEIES